MGIVQAVRSDDAGGFKDVYEFHARVCKALADPKRLLIVTELGGGPRSVGDLAAALRTSQPNVSRHLAVLRDRGLVTTERAGNSIFYSLVSPKILQAINLLREVMAEVQGWQVADVHPLARAEVNSAAG